METPKEESILKCDLCERYPRLEGTNKCESSYTVVRHFLEQDPRFKDTLLPDLRKKQETLEKALYNEFMDNPTISSKDREVFIKGGLFGAKWQQEQEKITTDDAFSYCFENGKHWQQERSYSEEEVFNILTKFWMWSTLHTTKEHLIKWFEQFKK